MFHKDFKYLTKVELFLDVANIDYAKVSKYVPGLGPVL